MPTAPLPADAFKVGGIDSKLKAEFTRQVRSEGITLKVGRAALDRSFKPTLQRGVKTEEEEEEEAEHEAADADDDEEGEGGAKKEGSADPNITMAAAGGASSGRSAAGGRGGGRGGKAAGKK